MVLKAVIVSCINQKMKLKGYVSIFTYEKAWGFGFNDAGPVLIYGSLGCARVSLHLD